MKKALPRFKVSSILDCFARAPLSVRNDGMVWYDRAQTLARELDPENPSRAAGILAALSPQKSWAQNVKLARACYALGEPVGHTGAMLRQARAIYQGADPLDVLRGPKVRQFYLCIMGLDGCCIDRHAVDIARGKRGANKDASILGRVGAYEKCQETYRKAAKILGISAAQLQAITWVQWRIEHGTGAD